MIDINQAFTRIDYRLELMESPEDQRRAFLKGLEAVCNDNTPTLNELRTWLKSTLDDGSEGDAESIAIPTNPKRQVVDSLSREKHFYQLELVSCGKAGCKCSKGKLHGPYWHQYWKDGGRVKSKYIGKELPAEEKPQ